LPRRSKYRHVFADQPKNEDCWNGIKLTNESWDSNYCAVNPKYIAISWDVGGGGAVGVLNINAPGKLQDVPLLSGHKGAVLDLDWSPFDDNLLATSSNDATVKVWLIGSGGPVDTDQSAQDLTGHTRKVGTVKWNPVAENILASSAADYNVVVHDVRSGEAACTVGGHTQLITACEWNYNGSILATACKDKKLRVIDPRAGNVVAEVDCTKYQGTKGNRLIFTGKRDYIINAGFGRTNARQYMIYDARSMGEPVLAPQKLDSSSGSLMPFYDMDTDLFFLAGKGDGNIRYYEIELDSGVVSNYISDFPTAIPAAGMGWMPKRGCDVSVNEIVKMYKVAANRIVYPISFRVPRKGDDFAADIFVPCSSDDPALNADQWLGGDNSDPRTKSLQGGVSNRPAKTTTTTAIKKKEVSDDTPTSTGELQKAYREMKQRITYLEAELTRAQNKIAELEGK